MEAELAQEEERRQSREEYLTLIRRIASSIVVMMGSPDAYELARECPLTEAFADDDDSAGSGDELLVATAGEPDLIGRNTSVFLGASVHDTG